MTTRPGSIEWRNELRAVCKRWGVLSASDHARRARHAGYIVVEMRSIPAEFIDAAEQLHAHIVSAAFEQGYIALTLGPMGEVA